MQTASAWGSGMEATSSAATATKSRIANPTPTYHHLLRLTWTGTTGARTSGSGDWSPSIAEIKSFTAVASLERHVRLEPGLTLVQQLNAPNCQILPTIPRSSPATGSRPAKTTSGVHKTTGV